MPYTNALLPGPTESRSLDKLTLPIAHPTVVACFLLNAQNSIPPSTEVWGCDIIKRLVPVTLRGLADARVILVTNLPSCSKTSVSSYTFQETTRDALHLRLSVNCHASNSIVNCA